MGRACVAGPYEVQVKLLRNAVGVVSELSGLLPVLAVYAVLARLHPQLGLAPVLYLAYAVGFILLPSYACARLLLKLDLGVAERICLGFPVSQALLFLLAWGGSRLGLSWWGALVLPGLGLFALWDLVVARGQARRSEPFFLMAVAAITAISLALCFRSFIVTALPGEGAQVFIQGDDAFMVVGTFSAIKGLLTGLPFMEARFGDIPFTYHILLMVNNGVAHLATGIHPLQLQFYFYPALTWYLLAGAVTAGARRFAGFDRTQTVLAACLLLYSSGLRFEATPWVQMYGNFHTYFASLPGAIILGMLLFGVLAGRLESFPGVYFFLLFFAVCAAKGVPLVLVPLSLLPVLLYRLLKRQLGLQDLKFTAGVLAAGLVLRVIEYTSLGQIVFKKFNVLNSSLELFANALEIAPFVFVIGLVATLNRLTRHELLKNRQYVLFVASTFLACVALTRTVDFVGGSQYFFWYFRIFLLIFVASYFGYALRLRKKAIRVAVAAVVLAAVSVFLFSQYQQLGKTKNWNELTVNESEADGLLWAYHNLDHSARMLTNSASAVLSRDGVLGSYGPMDYLATTGLYGYAWRYPWLPPRDAKVVDERLAKADAFWRATTKDERQRLLAQIPVDYLFVRKREDKGLDYTGLDGVRRIYTNEALDIYALRGATPQN